MANSSCDLGGISHFKGPNFHIWKFQMRAILLGRELIDVVDKSKIQPTATTATNVKVAWRKKHNQAISLLCQAMDECMLKHVTSCVTSKQMWNKLKLFYEQNEVHKTIILSPFVMFQLSKRTTTEYNLIWGLHLFLQILTPIIHGRYN